MPTAAWAFDCRRHGNLQKFVRVRESGGRLHTTRAAALAGGVGAVGGLELGQEYREQPAKHHHHRSADDNMSLCPAAAFQRRRNSPSRRAGIPSLPAIPARRPLVRFREFADALGTPLSRPIAACLFFSSRGRWPGGTTGKLATVPGRERWRERSPPTLLTS